MYSDKGPYIFYLTSQSAQNTLQLNQRFLVTQKDPPKIGLCFFLDHRCLTLVAIKTGVTHFKYSEKKRFIIDPNKLSISLIWIV